MASRVILSEDVLFSEAGGPPVDITALYGGDQGPSIQNPSGGVTQDGECRAVLVALLGFLRDRGDLAPP